MPGMGQRGGPWVDEGRRSAGLYGGRPSSPFLGEEAKPEILSLVFVFGSHRSANRMPVVPRC